MGSGEYEEWNRFSEGVRQGAPDELHEAFILQALDNHKDEFLKNERIRKDWKEERDEKAKRDLRESILEQADELQEEFAQTGKGSEGLWTLPETSDSAVIGEFFLRKLRPWIHSLREKQFNQSQPPFEHPSEAADWIEEKQRKNQETALSNPDREQFLDKLKVNGHELFEKALSLQIDWKYKWFTVKLPYIRPENEFDENVKTFPGTYLRTLAQQTSSVAKKTGFNQSHLVTTILSGDLPKYSRARVTTEPRILYQPESNLPWLQNQFVTVTFHTGDLKFEELRDLYKQIKNHLGQKGKKRFSKKAQKILNLVDDKFEGPPTDTPNSKEFWIKIKNNWNKTYPQDPYKDWHGPRKYYFEQKEKLKDLFGDFQMPEFDQSNE